MREALAARSDDDFIVEKIPRKPRGTKAGSGRAPARSARGEPGWGERYLLIALSHPREIIAVLLLLGCGGVIAYNALMMQRMVHPAPLFRKSAAIPAPVAVPTSPNRLPPVAAGDHLVAPERPASERPAAPAPVGVPVAPSLSGAAPTPHQAAPQPVPQTVPVPPRPGPRAPSNDATRTGPDTPPAAAPPRPPASGARNAETDTIADMIRMGGPVPVPPAMVGKPEPDDRVAAAQRALLKLGYGVRVDGLTGPGTRQAIETFERDRRLPVTGELTQRTIRELAVQSGIAIP